MLESTNALQVVASCSQIEKQVKLYFTNHFVYGHQTKVALPLDHLSLSFSSATMSTVIVEGSSSIYFAASIFKKHVPRETTAGSGAFPFPSPL